MGEGVSPTVANLVVWTIPLVQTRKIEAHPPYRRLATMELIVFVLLVTLLGLAATRWGIDSTSGMPDGYRPR